jgi:hypothetical protein
MSVFLALAALTAVSAAPTKTWHCASFFKTGPHIELDVTGLGTNRLILSNLRGDAAFPLEMVALASIQRSPYYKRGGIFSKYFQRFAANAKFNGRWYDAQLFSPDMKSVSEMRVGPASETGTTLTCKELAKKK